MTLIAHCLVVCLKSAPVASYGPWKYFWVLPLNPAPYDLPVLHFKSFAMDTLVMALQILGQGFGLQ